MAKVVDERLRQIAYDRSDMRSEVEGRMRARLPDLAAVALLVAATLTLHRLRGFLGNPYWVDEAWVAATGKAQLSDLPWLTAASPLGWTAVIWALPSHGQIQRLVPWLSMAGSGIAAYMLARLVHWPSRAWSLLAGVTAGLAALAVTAQAYRNDLKQYTADALVTLVLLALLATLEAGWTRRRAAVLGGAVVAGMLFSHTAALTGGAVLGAVLIMRRRHLVEGLAFCGLTGLGMIAMYAVADGATRNDSLSDYWANFFPSVTALPGFLLDKLNVLEQAFGMPWPLFIALVLVGIATIARYGRPATAAAIVALPVVEVLAGFARKYPVLDQRTSHFLLVSGAAVAGVGIVGALSLLRARLPVLAAGAVVVALLCGYTVINRQILLHPLRPGLSEDVRSQTRYVAVHRRPGDLIVVGSGGSFGFAYYWNADRPEFYRGGTMATGWYIGYPPQDRIIVMNQFDPEQMAAALAQSGNANVWIVLSHVSGEEQATWNVLLTGRSVKRLSVGSEPLLLVSPATPTPGR